MEDIVVFPHYHHPTKFAFENVQPDWECDLCARYIVGGYPYPSSRVFVGFWPNETDRNYICRMKERGYNVIKIHPELRLRVGEFDYQAGQILYEEIYGKPDSDVHYPKAVHEFEEGCCQWPEDDIVHTGRKVSDH